MNFVIFLLWFGMICIPQFVFQGHNSLKKVSNITCLLQHPTSAMCSNESISRASITVLAAPAHCLTRQQDEDDLMLGIVNIRECNVENGIGVSEGSNVRIVSPELVDGSSCDIVERSVSNYDTLVANATSYSVCIGVKARVLWYQHVLDFISGTGFFNETVLFHGVYNSSVGGYDLSLAFLFTTAVIYGIGVLLLVYK